MPLELPVTLGRVVRILALAAFLAVGLGYVAFDSVYPNLAWPPMGETFMPLMLLVLLTSGILAGFLTEQLQDGVVEAFLSLPMGALVATALALSPVLTGIVQVQADFVIYDTIRNGLLVYILGLILYFFGIFVGLGVRDRYIVRGRRVSASLRR